MTFKTILTVVVATILLSVSVYGYEVIPPLVDCPQAEELNLAVTQAECVAVKAWCSPQNLTQEECMLLLDFHDGATIEDTIEDAQGTAFHFTFQGRKVYVSTLVLIVLLAIIGLLIVFSLIRKRYHR